MPQSFAQIYLHIVYSTKHRTPFLQDSEFRVNVHAYLAGTCNNLDCPALIVGGTADHVHILCRYGRDIKIKDLIRDLKIESSKWIKEHGTFPELMKFYWQQGYGAFSISPSHVDKLTKYIAGQEEHHRKESFQDELRRLLKIYRVPYDEKYIWD